VVRDLRYMQSLGTQAPSQAKVDGHWVAPIVKTVAARGEGADEVVDRIEQHGDWLRATGRLEERRRQRAADEVEAIALTVLRARMGDLRGGDALDRLAGRVVAGELDPYAAADELVAGVTA
jgi:LAO/AO transport system kinase